MAKSKKNKTNLNKSKKSKTNLSKSKKSKTNLSKSKKSKTNLNKSKKSKVNLNNSQKNRTNLNKKKPKVKNGKASCATMFHHVLNAAHNTKYSEFSLRRKSVEISDTLKKSIKKTTSSPHAEKLEFKSCFVQLSRVKNTNLKKRHLKEKIFQVKISSNGDKLLTENKPTVKIPSKSKFITVRNNMSSHNKICKERSKTTHETYIIPAVIVNEINKYAKEAMTLGWSLMRKQLPYFIQHCINKRELDLFSEGLKLMSNNIPSSNFVHNYVRKYKHIYKDILEEKASKTLTSMDEKNLFYFNLCWHLINQYAIKTESFLNEENKNRIFCCGDYSFSSDYKNIIEITEGFAQNNKKKGDNVFFCVSATGKVFNPLVLNRGITVKIYESSIYADNKYWQQASESGQMCAEAFHLWLITAFKPHLLDDKIKKPVILFFNSDAPYLSIPVLNFCKENEIILFAIPSQFANLVNPLDMKCFDTLGMEYCRIFRKRAEETIGKAKDFSPLILIAAMERIKFNSCAQSAFDLSGLLKKDSYSRVSVKKSSQINIEDRLPSHLKNSSYNLGKQIGKLMCYHEIMSSAGMELNTTQTTDVEKRFFNRIKKLYLEQSEKCTEIIDIYDGHSPKVEIPSHVNSMVTLNAENILRIQTPNRY